MARLRIMLNGGKIHVEIHLQTTDLSICLPYHIAAQRADMLRLAALKPDYVCRMETRIGRRTQGETQITYLSSETCWLGNFQQHFVVNTFCKIGVSG